MYPQQLYQKTPEQQRQDDVIFLSQNSQTKYFNINNFTTNFLHNTKSKNTDALGTEALVQRDCEKSPLFFKLSGCVSYCPQLGGCCIFYNGGITEQQMEILYSVICQREIFDKVCKVYENSIPSFGQLFQLTFSTKLSEQFKLLGLSVDTLILKIRNETPSQRNKFIYNTAMLQLQMLRYDFIISPNLTQYYMKQFLGNPLCVPPPPPPPQQQQNDLFISTPLPLPQENIINGTKSVDIESPSKCIISTDYPQKTQNVYIDDNSEEYSEDDDDDDDDEEDEYEYDDDIVEKQPIIIKNTSLKNNGGSGDGGGNAIPKLYTLPTKKQVESLASSSSSSLTRFKRKNNKTQSISTLSSVEFIHPSVSGQSETGITEKFAKLKCKQQPPSTRQYDAASSTGITENVAELCLDTSGMDVETFFNQQDNDYDGDYLDDDYNETDGAVGGYNGSSNIIESKVNDRSVAITKAEEDAFISQYFDDIDRKMADGTKSLRSYYTLDDEGRIVYKFDFLALYAHSDDYEFIQELFDSFSDLHADVEPYIRKMNYTRKNKAKITLALTDVKIDPTNRLKQAAFLYLISDLIKLANV